MDDYPTDGGGGGEMDECLQKLSRDVQAIKEELALDRESARANSMAIAADIKVLKDDIALQIKLHQLDFAYRNCELGKFRYWFDNLMYGCSDSLVQDMVLEFRGGFGLRIDGYIKLDPRDTKEAETAEFHNMLSEQFMWLTGVKPRIEREGGSYMIYYS